MKTKIYFKLIESIYVLLIIIPALFCIGCEEDFNPKIDMKPKYVLNCIINHGWDPDARDTTAEINLGVLAYLSRTYDIDGFIPGRADSSAYIKGADISIMYMNQYNTLKDTTVFMRSRFDSTLTDTTIRYKCYCASSWFFMEGGRVKLLARMPDGTPLSSEITIPRSAYFEMKPKFESGVTSQVHQSSWNNALEFNWYESYYSDCLYFPKLEIFGVVFSTNKPIRIEVPCRYVKQGEKYIAVYPGAVRDYKVAFEYAALDSAMKNISKGYGNKSDINITVCKFSVTVFERSLAAFYTSTKGYMDSYSVRLDQNVYSNIIGGYGIFGSSVYNYKTYPMQKTYVRSFGYE